MDGIKRVQIDAKDAVAQLRKAVKDDEEFVLFDGEEPLFQCVPVARVLEKAKHYLTHFPHEPAECLNTCWRHDPKVQAEAEAEALAEAEEDGGGPAEAEAEAAAPVDA